MFCAFEDDPKILRLYGNANVINTTDGNRQKSVDLFPMIPGAHQVIDMRVDPEQASYGMAVPYYKFQEEHQQLLRWADKRGDIGLQQYRQEKNQISLGGKPTGTS
jgi:hypothetical protein